MTTAIYDSLSTFAVSAGGREHVIAAQLAAERGDLQTMHIFRFFQKKKKKKKSKINRIFDACLAKGAVTGDSLCTYNLACSLCNPGSCQDVQGGAGCYLFLLRKNKHFPAESYAVLLAAVENLAMMLRQLGGEGGIPRATELPFDALETLRAAAKGAKERAKKEGKKNTKLRVAADAARVIVHFTDGFLSWDTSRSRVVGGESFSSEGVQTLRKAAVRCYGKALDIGKDVPRSVGVPLIDSILPYVAEHLEMAQGNIEQLTQNRTEFKLQGVRTPGGDFLGLGPDGELHFIPEAETRPWLSDSSADRQYFFSGLHLGESSPQLKAVTCAFGTCSETLELQKCSGCRKVSYCSRKHQEAHWAEHKKKCREHASGHVAEDKATSSQSSQQPLPRSKS
ncbi:unnamed protein product [Polarella glacialis]|uniref:MYND-type domain-containing protein n=1 Tax=Polarella glacialis TaxID=89957 RepID=A0A813HDT1_POLGL|nr:unnamed protein product [Polarella glacialis]CAE8636438.1 unnamed protein product [Polarella glacialis]